MVMKHNKWKEDGSYRFFLFVILYSISKEDFHLYQLNTR